MLQAMGVDPYLARGAVRISLGAGNTAEQVEDFLVTLQSTIKEIATTNRDGGFNSEPLGDNKMLKLPIYPGFTQQPHPVDPRVTAKKPSPIWSKIRQSGITFACLRLRESKPLSKSSG